MSMAKLPDAVPDLSLGLEPIVLVVDDDPVCLAEYAEMICQLRYPCLAFADPVLALQHISSNPRIGIILTDIDMPVLDGLALLEEVSSRFMPKRPIAAFAITGTPCLETAVAAMRLRAIDFLSKPVARSDLAAALRRASQKIALETDRANLKKLTEIIKGRQPQETGLDTSQNTAAATPAKATDDLMAAVRSMIKTRQARYDYLDEELFSDPSWDILLELTSAKLLGEPVPSSSACAATNAPMTTALRYISKLVDAGLVKRWKDPNHGRRVLLELTPSTFETMKSYLISTAIRSG